MGAAHLRILGAMPPIGGVWGRKPPKIFKDFMLILDPGSTCTWQCHKKLTSHSGCKNEQQADFEVQLKNRITFTRHYFIIVNHNCKQLSSKLQPKVQNARGKFAGFYVNLRPEEHL